jgi:7-keto-8-aminopelargonate synthetase-like enzyme
VHMVGFTIGIYYDARTYERQICTVLGVADAVSFRDGWVSNRPLLSACI